MISSNIFDPIFFSPKKINHDDLPIQCVFFFFCFVSRKKSVFFQMMIIHYRITTFVCPKFIQPFLSIIHSICLYQQKNESNHLVVIIIIYFQMTTWKEKTKQKKIIDDFYFHTQVSFIDLIFEIVFYLVLFPDLCHHLYFKKYYYIASMTMLMMKNII